MPFFPVVSVLRLVSTANLIETTSSPPPCPFPLPLPVHDSADPRFSPLLFLSLLSLSTRCIRFTSEICGIVALGMTGRGNQTEVGTYIDRMLDSELSGNVIDLCPVGALTSKPYSFSTRPWELVKTESVDTMDAVGSAIRIDTRGPEVMRILPRLNEDVNEEWIGDKSRFAYDGLKRQRIDAPLVKQGDAFVPVSWSAALITLRDRLKGLKGEDILGVVGEQADAEAMMALKDWMAALGSSNVISTQYPLPFNRRRPGYLFSSTIAGIEEADALLLVNCNPRMEAAVISARIRKSVRQFGQQVMSVGPRMDLNLPHTHIGDSLHSLHSFVRGMKGAGKEEEKGAKKSDDGVAGADAEEDEAAAARHVFRHAKRPMVIVGMGAFKEERMGKAVMAALDELKAAVPALSSPSWSGVNILHTNASAVGALDLGIGNSGVKVRPQSAKFVYLLGADHVEELSSTLFAPDAFVVYTGSHGDVGASLADLVLPAPAYTEKSGTYVNMEGRVQRTKAAVGRLAEAREDWQIIRAASELTQTPLPYHSMEQVRERLAHIAPSFSHLETLHTAQPGAAQGDSQEGHEKLTSAVDAKEAAKEAASSSSASSPLSPSTPSRFVGWYSNYFFTDPISRSSATMAKCSASLPQSRNSYSEQHQQQQKTQTNEATPAQPAAYAAERAHNPQQGSYR